MMSGAKCPASHIQAICLMPNILHWRLRACIRNERIVDGDIKDGEDRNGNQEAGKKKRDLRIEDSSLDSGSLLALSYRMTALQ